MRVQFSDIKYFSHCCAHFIFSKSQGACYGLQALFSEPLISLTSFSPCLHHSSYTGPLTYTRFSLRIFPPSVYSAYSILPTDTYIASSLTSFPICSLRPITTLYLKSKPPSYLQNSSSHLLSYICFP